MSRPYREPGRSRRPSQRRWLTLHSMILGALIALLAGAGINGWRWFPSGRTILNQVQQAGERLPAVGQLGQRVLFVSPHPDDETLAAAGMLQDVQQHGGQVFVVFLTSGDGFPWDVRATTFKALPRPADNLALGRRRMAEARAATAALGIPPQNVTFLGFPDRGLTALYHQNYLIPFTSPYTAVARVPYAGTFSTGAPYTGQSLEKELNQVFDAVKPDVVLAPSVMDGHPDHRTASYVATRLASERGERLYYYLVHGGLEWPLPKGLHPGLDLSPPATDQQGVRWRRYDLEGTEQDRKAQAVRAYKTQLRIIPRFMWAFVRRNELLLPAPSAVSNEK